MPPPLPLPLPEPPAAAPATSVSHELVTAPEMPVVVVQDPTILAPIVGVAGITTPALVGVGKSLLKAEKMARASYLSVAEQVRVVVEVLL